MVKQLKLKQNEVFLIFDDSEISYFLGYESSSSYLIITKGEYYFFTDARYIVSAKEKLEPFGVKVELLNSISQIKTLLDKLNIKQVGIDYSRTTLKEKNDLKVLGVKLKDISNRLEKIFSIKNKEEIASIKKACEITQSAFYTVLKKIKIGISEREIANELEYEMKKLGAEKPSFDFIVAFNENSAVPHHKTSDKKLENNSVILMDIGCKYNDYSADYTRTVFFGNPSEKFIDCYQKTQNANELAESDIVSGMTCKDADKIARDYLKANDLDKYFTHSLGHGVGVNIHEYPYLSPKRDKDKLRNSMVFSIEPGVYFENEFGIRIEDTVYLKNGKVKRLFNDNKNLIIIKDNI